MDFINLVCLKQKELNISNKEMSDYLGISEFVYKEFLLKKVRLTKLLYYGICHKLDISIVDDDSLCSLLDNHNKTVDSIYDIGLGTTDIENTSYVESIEHELKHLRNLRDSDRSKTDVIIKLNVKISELEHEIQSIKDSEREKCQESYIKGLKDGTSKYDMMLNEQMKSFCNDTLSEYSSKIDRLQSALDVSEKRYLSLYRYLDSCSKGVSVCNIDISSFERPLQLYEEELGLVLTDEEIKSLLYDYYVLNLHVEEISLKHHINRSRVEQIILTYDAKYIDGVIQYVKKGL